MRIMQVVLCALALFMLLDGHAQATQAAWQLLGRHGECAPIAALKRKLPDLPAISTPDELAAHLEAKRLKFTRSPLKGGPDGAVEFNVPDAGLAIVLVEARHCAAKSPSAR